MGLLLPSGAHRNPGAAGAASGTTGSFWDMQPGPEAKRLPGLLSSVSQAAVCRMIHFRAERAFRGRWAQPHQVEEELKPRASPLFFHVHFFHASPLPGLAGLGTRAAGEEIPAGGHWEVRVRPVMNVSVQPPAMVPCWEHRPGAGLPTSVPALPLTSRLTLEKLPKLEPQFPHLYLPRRFIERTE